MQLNVLLRHEIGEARRKSMPNPRRAQTHISCQTHSTWEDEPVRSNPDECGSIPGLGGPFPSAASYRTTWGRDGFSAIVNPIANGRYFSDRGRRTGKIRKKPEAYRRVLSRFELSAARDERRWRREEEEREGRGGRDGRRRAEKRCACPRERASNRESRGREMKLPFKAQIVQ